MLKDWEQAYAEGDTPWDKGSAAPPLVEYLEVHQIAGRVLVPGCGTGHDARVLAEAGAEVTGIDFAPRALATARKSAGAGAVRWVEGDFLRLDEEEWDAYDWVVEHTCLCAIDPVQREAYVQSVRQALKAGGFYWAVFFRQVSHYDGSGPPHPIDAAEIDTLFAKGFELIQSYTPERTYSCRPKGREEVRLYRRV